jgi:predicted transposase/invertase (TIGR01784 family)
MIAQLKKQGAVVEERFPGIYYVTGCMLFDTQIVVTGKLREEEHSSLRILSKDVKEADVRRFLAESEELVTPGDRNNIDAVLQVSVLANRDVYKKVKEDQIMCEALRELMKEEIDAEVEKGMEKGMEKGKAEGTLLAISNLMKSMKLNAEQAMEALGIPANEWASYRAKL